MADSGNLRPVSDDDDREEYCGPNELLYVKHMLETVIEEMRQADNDFIEGRLLSALQDVEFAIDTFTWTKKEIAEMDAEDARKAQAAESPH